MSESWRVCNSCGRELEMAAGQSLGEALSGWYILSRIRDSTYFDRTSFCCMDCLTSWIQNQQTAVPEVFRRSFDDGLVY
jgi:hypothetical protein